MLATSSAECGAVMSAAQCEPGSVIVAGDGGPWPADWVLGYAVRIQRRWLREVVVDEQGQRWCGVTVLPQGTYELVDGHHQGWPYPAARPLQGRSLAGERAHRPTAGAVACLAPTGPRSSRKDRKAVFGVNRTRPLNPV